MLGSAALALAVMAPAVPAAAQPPAAAVASSPAPAPASKGAAVDPAALRSLRLERLRERRVEGGVLLGWGAANLVGGALVAGLAARRNDDFWLGFGATSAGWGLVNGLLSLALLDLGGGQRAAAQAGRLGSGSNALDDPTAVARRLSYDELRSGQVFALNLGLDVFYVATGVLLALLGDARNELGLEGAGASLVAQGAFLFVFDVFGWRGANRQSARYRALLAEPR